jgi:hypothetical protein
MRDDKSHDGFKVFFHDFIVATSIMNEIGREVTVSRADDTMKISWLVVYLPL